MILQGESYEFWYCLPDSRFFPVCNPETSSRVTLATLGTVFQTGIVGCWYYTEINWQVYLYSNRKPTTDNRFLYIFIY